MRAWRWWTARDVGLRWTRRAARIAVATSVAFCTARYLLDDVVMSLYASFGVIALAGLSEVAGTPGERARTYTLATAAGAALVTLGTYLSITTLTATLGMAVVGFTVAYAGVGGPAVAGVAGGLQLLYILPSFPPYDPGSLGSRIAGLGLGLACLLLTDRFVLAPEVPVPYERTLAAAVDALAARLSLVRRSMAGESVPVAEREQADAVAAGALEASRLGALPALSRPSGPDRCSRALWAAGSLTRVCSARVTDLQGALASSGSTRRAHRGSALLDQAGRALHDCARALRAGPPPSSSGLDEAIASGLADRERWLVDAVGEDDSLGARTAVGSRTFEVAAAVRELTVAVRVSRGSAADAGQVDGRLFWFARRSDPALLLVRLRGQLDPGSVWLQNALRVALALAAARALAGVLDFSHGFWVLLATLTLLRTTASATRSAIRPAIVGTLAGALLAAPFLLALAPDTIVLAVLFPALVFVAFALGPVVGVPYGQAGLTLVVAGLFAQVAPASWSLAGWRLLDVAVGALVGVGAGLLAWPRGASGQLVAQCGQSLRVCAGALMSTTHGLTGTEPPDADVDDRARHVLARTTETVAFAMAEQGASGTGTRWWEVLAACHHMAEGGDHVRLRRVGRDPIAWPEAVELLEAVADHDRQAAYAVAAALADPPAHVDEMDTAAADEDFERWLRHVVDPGDRAADPAVLDVIDARAWLVAVARDLHRLPTPTVPS